MPNTKWMLSKWPKSFNSVPKRRNYAQSGHTDRKRSKVSTYESFSSFIIWPFWDRSKSRRYDDPVMIVMIGKSLQKCLRQSYFVRHDEVKVVQLKVRSDETRKTQWTTLLLAGCVKSSELEKSLS